MQAEIKPFMETSGRDVTPAIHIQNKLSYKQLDCDDRHSCTSESMQVVTLTQLKLFSKQSLFRNAAINVMCYVLMQNRGIEEVEEQQKKKI